ncbi:MAG: hypothetical protein IRZ08_06860 [Frankia sp.]|nr:hypothetical protein [Frankia sp.]
MPKIGGRDVAIYDIGILAAGFVMFILSFVPWFSVEFRSEFVESSDSANGWQLGFWSSAAISLVLGVTVSTAFQVLGRTKVSSVGPVPGELPPVVAGALAVLFILIRWVDLPEGGAGVDTGAGVGLYLGLIAALALTAFTVLRLLQTGGGARPRPAAAPGGWPQGPQQPGGWPPPQAPQTPQPGGWPQTGPAQPGGWPQAQQPPQTPQPPQAPQTPQPGAWPQTGPAQPGGWPQSQQPGGWGQPPR